MFTKEFVEEAKALYPTWDQLHTAIEHGDGIIGRFLFDASQEAIHYSEILKANSLEELKERAMKIKRRVDLYIAYVSGACYKTKEEDENGEICY